MEEAWFLLAWALLPGAHASKQTMIVDVGGGNQIVLQVEADGTITSARLRRPTHPTTFLTEQQSADPGPWRPPAASLEDFLPPPQRNPLIQTLTVDMPERDWATGLRAEHFAGCIEDRDFQRAELRVHQLAENGWEQVEPW